jgi:2-succinyl-6-hydroxy-2,4-cyclohexadiene-1-carboxylate synthase
VPLHVEVRGSGPPLTLLHGFTQTGRLWGSFGDLVARDFTIIAVDLPGHGDSGEVRADVPATAELVREAVVSVLGDTPTSLLGYSMGARVALHVALQTDLALEHLVLIGGTAGIEDEAERAERRKADDAMADALEASGDVDGFIARWVSSPMFARLGGAAQTEERLRNTAAGLVSSLRLAGAGTHPPLWDQLSELRVPLLALAGSDDTRYASRALRMAALTRPDGAATLIPGGGHAAHLAQPEVSWRLVRHRLEGVLTAGSRS